MNGHKVRSMILSLVTVFALLPMMPARAESSVSLRLVGQIGGPTTCVAVRGSYAYVGVGLHLEVLSISNPAQMRQVGATTPFPHFAEGVALDPARPYAYVAAGGAGLRVVDVSNPTNPVEVGAWDSPGYAEGIAVSGTTAYLADGPYGLRCVDVSDPWHPRPLGAAYDMSYAFDVAVAGGRAYVAAAGAGLLIADVSDPAHPVELGALDTPGYAYGIAVAGGTAYVADGWEGLRVVGVADPAHPRELGSLKTPGWAFGAAVSGTRAYVADAFMGLRVLDVADPSHPRALGGYEVAGGHAGGVALSGSVAYVADRNGGLRAVSVSDPAHPAQAGFYSPLGYADGVAVAGSHAYVAAATYGLRVVDISDPARPRQAGAVAIPAYTTSVGVAGAHAFVVTSSPGSAFGGLGVADISDPIHPSLVAECALNGGFGIDLALYRGAAYIADEWGLEVVGIADPRSPETQGFVQLWEYCGAPDAVEGVVVSSTLAYLASSFAGLEIVDVANPGNMTLVGTYNDGSCFAQDTAIAGNRVYVAGWHDLRIVDVSDPWHPTEVGRYDTPGEAEVVALAGQVAYVACGSGGIVALNVSDPRNPALLAAFDTPGYAHEVTVSGSRVYVADGPTGLLILELAEAARAQSPLVATIASSPGAAWHPEQQPARSAPASRPSVDRDAPHVPPLTGGLRGVGGLGLGSRLSARSPMAPQPSPAFLPASVPPPGRAGDMAVCLVTSAADGGPGSLRQCLESVGHGGTIRFDPAAFPPARPVTITLLAPLPPLDQGAVTLDASAAGVILDGAGTPAGTHGLLITSSSNVVKGLQIVRFPEDGIHLTDGASDNRIGGPNPGERNIISGNGRGGVCIVGSQTMSNTLVGNYIGTDASGSRLLGNGGAGVHIWSPHNRVGGPSPQERNIISGNGYTGVICQGDQAHDNWIVGNYCGTDVTGTADLGNRGHGISMEVGAYANRVQGNVTSGNSRTGVAIGDWGGSYNTVIGNLIGTDASGTHALPNDEGGVSVGYGGASFNRIGGTRPGEGNLVSGNPNGVWVGGAGATGNLILGNLIGTDVTGRRALGNGEGGVGLGASSRTVVGGTTPEERNLIGGSRRPGVSVESGYSAILGNDVGTDATGTAAIGNRWAGVRILADHTVVQGNVIAHTAFFGQSDMAFGVEVVTGIHNTIRRNSITSNAARGIRLVEGGNGGLAAPLIARADRASVTGTACPNCTVELFSDAEDEGRVYEGTVIADGTGVFTFNKPGRLTGPYITATATDAEGNTSEFSAPRLAAWGRVSLPLVLRCRAGGVSGLSSVARADWDGRVLSQALATHSIALARNPPVALSQARARRDGAGCHQGPDRVRPARQFLTLTLRLCLSLQGGGKAVPAQLAGLPLKIGKGRFGM